MAKNRKSKAAAPEHPNRASFLNEMVAGLRHAAAVGTVTAAEKVDSARDQLTKRLRHWQGELDARVERRLTQLDQVSRRLSDSAHQWGSRIDPGVGSPLGGMRFRHGEDAPEA